MDIFAASEGRTSTIHLYMHGLDGALKFSDIEEYPKFLKFSYEPDTSYSGTGKGSKRYLLTFKIPPGSPKGIRKNQTAAKVHLKTNHPEVPEMTFRVRFISR